jgi:hypothetical protein
MAMAMMNVLIKKRLRAHSLEIRNLKIPATGNPCVFTVG